ncbi:cytochrome bc1 complex diheme cytochrome c subunit [Kineosporia succinea]|uniref:Cytochrome bc1 complex cytochrome c subunit n=1 Tax=Kineosporia succinea TaxID=84632 RepID=A0ABT9P6C1_9ACTN|nr:c-type cytochrome [Kineosporia succinea]MDP9828231.1 ubiquinol-cytochrome c reductase cytochrome c subunit [Kineosporia succinea]
MSALAARRRHPLATALIVLLGLLVTGVAYAAVMPSTADASTSSASADDLEQGKKLFLANCSTCHGIDAEGRNEAPSLIGVGAAAVDFQVGTGRMPLAASGPQAPEAPVRLNDEQTAQLSAYVASLGAGPSIPTDDMIDPAEGDASKGAMIFRTNCAMCHNSAGAGGALTKGKFAPSLDDVSYKHIYEAMVSGPQSMPVFPDTTISPEEKQDVIAYLATIRETPNPGGLSLGRLGPVSEGLVAWIVGLTVLLGFAVWLGAKSS